MTVGDGESATGSSICSQCSAILAASGKRDDGTQGYRGTAESTGTSTSDHDNDYCLIAHTFSYYRFLWSAFQIVSIYYHLEIRSVSRRHRFENERGMGESRSRGNKTDRRFRRLEKTVESLSHGLILALTQLNSRDMRADTEPHHRGSGPHPHHLPGHSDVPNNEIESVTRDHFDEDEDDDRGLSTVFTELGFTEHCTETFILMLVAADY